MILVVADGKTALGGSQFFEFSATQGNYEDFVCDEMFPPSRRGNRRRRMACAASSPEFQRRLWRAAVGQCAAELFDAVIAMSPDSDFPTSHLPLVKVASVANTPLVEIKKIAAGNCRCQRTAT